MSLSINGAAPHVSLSGPKWQGAYIRGEGDIKRSARQQARRTSDLELAFQLNWHVARWRWDFDGLSIDIDKSEMKFMPLICLVPRHFDLDSERRRDWAWSGHRPTATENIQFAFNCLGRVGEQKGNLHARSAVGHGAYAASTLGSSFGFGSDRPALGYVVRP
jgi:hypothetical protein